MALVLAGPIVSREKAYRPRSFPREPLAGKVLERLDVPRSRAGNDGIGQRRRRARLVPARRLQPIPYKLLVKRRLRTAGPIAACRPVPRAIRSEHLVDQQELAGAVVKPPFELG